MKLPGPVIGVVHLLPLPGSPGYGGRMEPVLARARSDARALAAGGADAVLVENYGDAPFFKEAVPPETVAALTRCAIEAAEASGLPLGVNALRNDARAALAVAVAAGARFLRVNVLAGVVATDQGLIEGRAAEVQRARAAWGGGVAILADALVKHARTLHASSAAGAARDLLARAGADAVILSGEATGAAVDPARLEEVRRALPRAAIYVGSGATERSAPDLLRWADGIIVGTSVKRAGVTRNPVDPERVRRFVRAVRAASRRASR